MMAGDASAPPGARSFADVMDEVNARLSSMEISCQDVIGGGGEAMGGAAAAAESSATILTPRRSQMELLQLQVAHLKAQLAAAVARKEEEDLVFKQAAAYATAKGSANAVLHALFDQVKGGKPSVLASWLDTGIIPTRDGFQHWKVDLRGLRDENGATLLHVAVDVSMKPEKVKLKLVHLLLDRVGFDPNVHDLFGRTPLHTAAMSGYSEVVKVLLSSGCDPLAQDRSGLTALSLVRTLSRPREEVVQVLAGAESAALRDSTSVSSAIAPRKAIASALFLRSLSRFILPQRRSEYTKQTTALLSALLCVKHDQVVSLDQFVREYASVLFDSSPASGVVRLKGLFADAAYRDPWFIEELKVEADGYGVSLVTPLPVTSALSGSSWIGILLKMVRFVKLELAMVDKSPELQVDEMDMVSPSRMSCSSGQTASSQALSDIDAASSIDSEALAQRLTYYAERQSSQTRQAWYYAVLFKAATNALPGTLSLKSKSDIAVSSEDLSKFFPLDSRLLIGSEEYSVVSYSPATRELKLDHEYEGKDVANVKAYASCASSAALPPYIAVKRIWEREPGNKYEEHTSSEQELFQDYQFLDPESDYEVAVKLGPLPTAKDAKKVVDEWKKLTKQKFEAKACVSGLRSCDFHCPQREGHSLCLGTMTALGRDLAKKHLGWPTLSKPMKPRASLQKLENRFKGTDPWPGSPSRVIPVTSSTEP